MTTSVDELAGQIRAQAVEAVVRREAPALAIDADQLLDSRAFRTATGALNPASPDFTAQVRQAARTAAEAVPRFRAAAPSAPAPAPAPQQWTLSDVEAARTPQEVMAAGEAGLLRNLGYAPRRKRGIR